ncbi:hypothetical protein ACKKBG_A02025 [Auxenochlorella protothecoides x Auxenochlorella symbiontica]
MQGYPTGPGLDLGAMQGLQSISLLGSFAPLVEAPEQASGQSPLDSPGHEQGVSGGHDSLTGPGMALKGRSGPLYCQVEGCGAQLEGLKEYHRRYKVCEYHLKVDCIMRNGVRSRFCQQCGRYQPLEDFDDTKRSCRVRLQRHNQRRRKRPNEEEDGLRPLVPGAPLGQRDVQVMQEALQLASNALLQAAQSGRPPDPVQLAQLQALVSLRGLHPPDARGAAECAGECSAAGSGGGGGAGVQGRYGVPIAGAAPAPPAIAREGDGAPAGTGVATAAPPGAAPGVAFVPTPEVMLLLLKGYAGMFNYALEDASLRPLPDPCTAADGALDPGTMAAFMPLPGGAMGEGIHPSLEQQMLF